MQIKRFTRGNWILVATLVFVVIFSYNALAVFQTLSIYREKKMLGIDGMSIGLFFLNFLYSVIATIIGGIVLAIFFFLTKEKIFPLPKVNGCWYFEIETKVTEYIPYRGMILRYVAVLWQEGPYIKGTLEKIYEKSSTGERNYVGENRTRGVVSGYLEKNYLSEDRVVLHVVEDGHGREYTNFYSLVVQSNHGMTGEFSSTVAGQSGNAKWQRTEF